MPRPLQIAREWSILLLGISLMATRLTFCNAQSCTWTDTAGKAGQQTQAAKTTITAGFAACQTKCLATSPCMAINYYTNLRCELFNSLPQLSDGIGVTFSEYLCATTTAAAPAPATITTGAPETTTTAPKTDTLTPEMTTIAPKTDTLTPEMTTTAPKTDTLTPEMTTTAPKTDTLTPETTTTAPKTDTLTNAQTDTTTCNTRQLCQGCRSACTMTRFDGFKGCSAAEFSFDLGPSLSQCESVCKTVSQCTAYSYGSSTCKLYESSTNKSASTGSQYASKGLCDDGKTRCCFTNSADKTAGGETVSLNSTMASCEDLCMTLSSCKAVTFSFGTCSLYTSTGKTSDVHSSYFEKNCSSGATDGSNTLTKACQGADRANISVSLLLIMAAFWTGFIL